MLLGKPFPRLPSRPLTALKRQVWPYLPFLTVGACLTLGVSVRSALRTVPPPEPGEISTVAGSALGAATAPDDSPDSDGGPAVGGRIRLPVAVAVGRDGTLLIAGRTDNRIYRIDSGGTVRSLAWGGQPARDGVRPAGSGAFSGDGGPARRCRFNRPAAVLSDLSGRIFVADTNNNRIRCISPRGGITTVAGSGPPHEAGFSGDGGPASRARLCRPSALAMDRKGTLYIADTGNHCVRKVDSRGIISTVAGNAALRDGRGTPLPGYDGDGGPATRARLNRPSGLAVGVRGELYIADTDNLRIRKVDTRGVISTVAGNGVATITPSGDVIHAFCGDYSRARSARLNRPMGIALDSFGNLFIADSGNHRVRMVKRDGTIVTVVGGGEPPDRIGDGLKAFDAQLDTPTSVALDRDGNLYVADPFNHRVRKVYGIAGPGLFCGGRPSRTFSP